MKQTGHRDAKGPWLPLGVGVHTGRAFVGVVGDEESTADFTALGDNVNITARLASQAGPGEVLISEASYAAADLKREDLEHRHLDLKGKSEPIGVRILRVDRTHSLTSHPGFHQLIEERMLSWKVLL